jgi:hypothetical protein
MSSLPARPVSAGALMGLAVLVAKFEVSRPPDNSVAGAVALNINPDTVDEFVQLNV